MCFEGGKHLLINNCLTEKLINMVINWSLGSYLHEEQLNKHKENIYTDLNFVTKTFYFYLKNKKQLVKTSLPHIGSKTMPFLLGNYYRVYWEEFFQVEWAVRKFSAGGRLPPHLPSR